MNRNFLMRNKTFLRNNTFEHKKPKKEDEEHVVITTEAKPESYKQKKEIKGGSLLNMVNLEGNNNKPKNKKLNSLKISL